MDNEFHAIDGHCEPCELYTKPSKDKKKCTYPQCKLNQIVTEDAKCQDCPKGQVAINDGHHCGERRILTTIKDLMQTKVNTYLLD